MHWGNSSVTHWEGPWKQTEKERPMSTSGLSPAMLVSLIHTLREGWGAQCEHRFPFLANLPSWGAPKFSGDTRPLIHSFILLAVQQYSL